MEVTRKIPKQKIIDINNFQTDLIKRRIVITQKSLITRAIEFSLTNKDQFLEMLKNTKTLRVFKK